MVGKKSVLGLSLFAADTIGPPLTPEFRLPHHYGAPVQVICALELLISFFWWRLGRPGIHRPERGLHHFDHRDQAPLESRAGKGAPGAEMTGLLIEEVGDPRREGESAIYRNLCRKIPTNVNDGFLISVN